MKKLVLVLSLFAANSAFAETQQCELLSGSVPYQVIVFDYNVKNGNQLVGKTVEVTVNGTSEVAKLTGAGKLGFDFQMDWTVAGNEITFSAIYTDEGVRAFLLSHSSTTVSTGYYKCEDYPFEI